MHRRTYNITGTVQGVGFRPTLYRLAREAGLGGWVQNRSGAVVLAIEGTVAAIEAFVATLPDALPAHARITEIMLAGDETITSSKPFHIKESGFDSQSNLTIPADLAMCPECRAEILDPANRRYRYPFTTCTHCGPRYTVVHAMPYDRSRTTLNRFPLCNACTREYQDPTNRRFHAESTACPDCGPIVTFRRQAPDSRPPPPPCDSAHATPSSPHAPLPAARAVLASGGILAVRGMGGFHLAVDATNPDAIQRLRQRKHRPAKPFAVMARNLEVVHRLCHCSSQEADILQSPEAPIVILDVNPQTAMHNPQLTDAPGRNPPAPCLSLIAPDTPTLGVLLPTTPLHLLLLEGGPDDPVPPFDFLIMTSGNHSAEPICIDNDEASQRLGNIADAFLTHNRDINCRNDDSLVITQKSGLQIWRRARGYAPNPVTVPVTMRRCVLAMGTELKNAIAVANDDRVILSPHIGDLSTPEARDAHERAARELPEFLDVRPDCIAIDLHPDMHCTRHGKACADSLGIPSITIQHHHAHAMGCLAENGHTSGLALLLDGTGLGPDGQIWGAELLHINGPDYTRLATFAPTPLPGGDTAVVEPTRQLVARWYAAGVTPSTDNLERCGIRQDQYTIWTRQCAQGINAPLTHAAGRLYDAFAALLGFAPPRTSYEGQAPIRLESAARRGTGNALLPFNSIEKDGLLSIDWSPAFTLLTAQHATVWQNADTARHVHNAIADAATTMAAFGRDQTGETRIALSGGVCMNRLLCALLIPRLEALGLHVVTHSQTPPNDGSIALGQAVIAGMMPPPD